MYEFSLYSYGLFVAAIINIVVGIIMWPKRKAHGANYLYYFLFCVFIWSFTIAFEAAGTTLPQKLFWSQLAYIGTVFSSLFFLLFVLAYTNLDRYITRRNTILLSVIPITTLCFVFFPPTIKWVWKEIVIATPNHIAIYHHGPWFWVFVAFSYFSIFTSILLLIRSIFTIPNFLSIQSVFVLVGGLFPVLANIGYITGFDIFNHYDFTPLTFSLMGVFFSIGFVRFKMFEIVPIARKKIIDVMLDGVLVIDDKYRILDINASLKKHFPVKMKHIVGKSATQFFEKWPILIDIILSDMEVHSEVQFTDNGTKVFLDVSKTSLQTINKNSKGWLVVFRDITKRKQAELEKEKIIFELESALKEVKTLSGLLPICSHCKNIRDDSGYWHRLEKYFSQHSDTEFSHGICPDCLKEHYPQFVDKIDDIDA